DLEIGLVEVERTIRTRERRQGFLDKLQTLAANGSGRAVQQGRALVARADLANDADAQPLLKKPIPAHNAAVTYTAIMERAEAPAEAETAPAVLIATALGKTTPPSIKDATVFGMAHGVCYALDARKGAPRWAVRLGADSTVPPLRVPATPV